MAAKKTPQLREKKVQKAVAKMSPPLHARYERILAALLDSVKGYADGRYRIGDEVAAIEAAPEKYGQQAVKLLSTAIGRNEDSLYRYAKVATTWPDKRTFNALLNRKNVHGVPLSFSHFIELSKVKSDKRRDQLLEEALTQGYPVRELARRIAENIAPREEEASKDAAVDLPKQLAQSLRSIERAAGQLTQLVGALQAAPTTPEFITTLEEATTKHQQLRTQIDAGLELLQQELERRRAGGGSIQAASADEPEEAQGRQPRGRRLTKRDAAVA
jgi:hypothetical protein